MPTLPTNPSVSSIITICSKTLWAGEVLVRWQVANRHLHDTTAASSKKLCSNQDSKKISLSLSLWKPALLIILKTDPMKDQYLSLSWHLLLTKLCKFQSIYPSSCYITSPMPFACNSLLFLSILTPHPNSNWTLLAASQVCLILSILLY